MRRYFEKQMNTLKETWKKRQEERAKQKAKRLEKRKQDIIKELQAENKNIFNSYLKEHHILEALHKKSPSEVSKILYNSKERRNFVGQTHRTVIDRIQSKQHRTFLKLQETFPMDALDYAIELTEQALRENPFYSRLWRKQAEQFVSWAEDAVLEAMVPEDASALIKKVERLQPETSYSHIDIQTRFATRCAEQSNDIGFPLLNDVLGEAAKGGWSWGPASIALVRMEYKDFRKFLVQAPEELVSSYESLTVRAFNVLGRTDAEWQEGFDENIKCDAPESYFKLVGKDVMKRTDSEDPEEIKDKTFFWRILDDDNISAVSPVLDHIGRPVSAIWVAEEKQVVATHGGLYSQDAKSILDKEEEGPYKNQLKAFFDAVEDYGKKAGNADVPTTFREAISRKNGGKNPFRTLQL